MSRRNGRAAVADPVGDTLTQTAPGEVLRLTDRDKVALAPYYQRLTQDQQELSQAIVLLLTGKGVDFATQEAHQTPDGEAFLIRPRAGPTAP